MRRLLISALLLCSAPVSAQHLAPEDYIFPLRNVAGLYSANFGAKCVPTTSIRA